ncbi:MAG: flippase-like domain-containing protein [Acutalibacter sp.]|nr:flippase-like domain-containing protein [Acutalibacter sp.]
MADQKNRTGGLPTAPEQENKKRKIPWGMLYILVTVIALVLFGVFNREFGNVFRTLSNLAPGFLLLAVVITVFYFVFEGGIIRLLMRSQNFPMRWGSALKISLIGIYYSYITPSATGGQPMQSAYLRRDKIPVGISAAVLIIKFFCFQCAFVLCSLLSFIFMYDKLTLENPAIIPFIILGLIVNGGSIIFFPSLFIKPVLHNICRFAKWLVKKMRFLGRFHLMDSIDRFEADFGSYRENFREKRGSVLWGILLSIPQFILQMSVIYFVFRAFGYHDIGYWEVFAVQSLLQVSVSFMPMPGASGAQEIGFSAFFRNYFAKDDLYSAVMVWRFFTYYLVVIAGALLVVVDQFLYGRRKKAEQESTTEE